MFNIPKLLQYLLLISGSRCFTGVKQFRFHVNQHSVNDEGILKKLEQLVEKNLLPQDTVYYIFDLLKSKTESLPADVPIVLDIKIDPDRPPIIELTGPKVSDLIKAAIGSSAHITAAQIFEISQKYSLNPETAQKAAKAMGLSILTP